MNCSLYREIKGMMMKVVILFSVVEKENEF